MRDGRLIKTKRCHPEGKHTTTSSPFKPGIYDTRTHKKDSLGCMERILSLPLSPAVRNATTFITGWSRYRYS